MMDDLLNGQQAAVYLNMSRQRLYLLTAKGRIGRKMASYWVFTKEELDSYLAEKPNASKGGRPKKTNSPYAITSS